MKTNDRIASAVGFEAGEFVLADGSVRGCPVLARDTLGDPARLDHDLIKAVLSDKGASAISRRDLMHAARLLEVKGIAALTTEELVAAIGDALREGAGYDLQSLVDTLHLAGRPTAANGLLDTLRQAA